MVRLGSVATTCPRPQAECAKGDSMEAAVLASIPTGPYINGYAVLGMVVVLVIFARLMTWVDKDAPLVHLNRQLMNVIMFAGLAVGVLVFLMAPLGLAVGFTVYIGILVVVLGVYLGLRYQKVGLSDIMQQLKDLTTSKNKKEAKEVKATAGQVVIVNKAGVPMPAPDPQTPEPQQYASLQLILTDALRRGAERIDVVGSNEGAAVSYLVDGFPYEGAVMDRSAAAAAIAMMKFVAGLDGNEMRKPQTGQFKTILNNVKREMKVTTRGSSTSESMTIIAEPKKRHSFSLDKLGFAPEQLQIVKDLITDGSGLVLLAAPPGHGLTALEYAIVRGHDAFLQHILTIERTPEQEIEGVTQNTLPVASTAQEEAKQVAWVVSQEPDAVLMA